MSRKGATESITSRCAPGEVMIKLRAFIWFCCLITALVTAAQAQIPTLKETTDFIANKLDGVSFTRRHVLPPPDNISYVEADSENVSFEGCTVTFRQVYEIHGDGVVNPNPVYRTIFSAGDLLPTSSSIGPWRRGEQVDSVYFVHFD